MTIRRGAITADAGTLSAEAPETLFVRGLGKVDEIAVVWGEHVVARGKPVY